MGRRPDCTEDQAGVKLVYGDFLPDLPDHGTNGVRDVSNVYPSSGGFRPVGQWEGHTDALGEPCRGASAFVAPSGRYVFIAGTATKLFRLNGLTWVEIGSGYTLTAAHRWRFVQFGQIAIATNGTDEMVKINLETDVVSLLGGSPPKFDALAVVNNFVVGTQMDGEVATVAWSGENNSEWWTFAQRKSDYQPLADGGEITGIIGGEVGLILQRNAVRRMAYVGGNVLFRFDKISSNVGCATVHSVAQYGEIAFWYSLTGFKMWDGAQIRSIGFEKVDHAFANNYGGLDFTNLSTAIDGERGTVCWSTGRMIWIYNWLLDKWSIINHEAEIIAPRETRGPHLEEQDLLVGPPDDVVEYPNLSPFDAARFAGGDPSLYVISDGIVGTFSGENMAAYVTGRRVEMVQGRDSRIRRVRPMTDAIDGITVRLDTRQRLGDGPRRGDFSGLRSSGEIPTRARGRFVTAKVSIAEDQTWTYLQGVDATVSASGSR